MAYITVTESVEVDVEIDLEDYKDEIEKILGDKYQEVDPLIEVISHLYKTNGALSVIEYIEKEINNLTGLPVNLRGV